MCAYHGCRYWTEVVSVPSLIPGEENLVLSRLEIEQIVLAKLEQDKAMIYEVSFKVRTKEYCLGEKSWKLYDCENRVVTLLSKCLKS